MVTSKVNYLGNLRTEATHLKSDSVIITDAPTDNNGKGEAFSPTDMVATSLASCMITIMGIKAASSNINIKGVSANVTKIMSSQPRKISEIQITLTFPNNNYSEKDKSILINAAKTCPVALSLDPNINQELDFIF